MIFSGSRRVLLRNPNFFRFFRGVRTPCPPLWIQTWCCIYDTGLHERPICFWRLIYTFIVCIFHELVFTWHTIKMFNWCEQTCYTLSGVWYTGRVLLLWCTLGVANKVTSWWNIFQSRHMSILCFNITCNSKQGSYRGVCVKFKDFSRTSQDYFTVFKD